MAPINSDARAPLPEKGLDGVVAALPVEMAGIDRASRPFGEDVVIDRDAAAFAAGHVLVIVEAERADVPDRAQLAAFVAAADPLAGVFDDDEIAALGDRHDRVHVACGAPHMNGHDGARARSDGGLDRLRIDRDGLVDIDDQRDRADREHRSRGRHIGVGRDDHFVAGAEADGGHRRGERVASAGGERESA